MDTYLANNSKVPVTALFGICICIIFTCEYRLLVVLCCLLKILVLIPFLNAKKFLIIIITAARDPTIVATSTDSVLLHDPSPGQR